MVLGVSRRSRTRITKKGICQDCSRVFTRAITRHGEIHHHANGCHEGSFPAHASSIAALGARIENQKMPRAKVPKVLLSRQKAKILLSKLRRPRKHEKPIEAKGREPASERRREEAETHVSVTEMCHFCVQKQAQTCGNASKPELLSSQHQRHENPRLARVSVCFQWFAKRPLALIMSQLL
jgi:hypothetical protein